MTQHPTATREQWISARLELLEEEKELTRRSDELARKRQNLPWVRVDKRYRFDTDEGSASLLDLFQERSQLLVYHFMFGPDYTAGCPSCSSIADGFNGVTVHLACHARAQNMGPKAAEMLKMIPDTPVDVIERCSGHGGTFGVVKPTHDVAVKVGRPVFKAVNAKPRGHIVSDCPLAAVHIVAHTDTPAREPEHPIQIMARAFGLRED